MKEGRRINKTRGEKGDQRNITREEADGENENVGEQLNPRAAALSRKEFPTRLITATPSSFIH